MPRLLADAFLQQTTVEPVVNEIALIVKGHSSQSVSLQEWQNSAGTPLAVISSTGAITGSNFSGPATTVTSATTFGIAAAVGTSIFMARQDHTHGTPTDPVTAHVAAGDPHTGYLLESVISGLATPAIVLGTAAAAGTGLTPIRHNATIAAFDATAPSTQAFSDAAVVGVINFAARRDHKHAMPVNPVTAHEAAGDPHTGYLLESVISALATPAIVLGTAAAAGTGTTPIRHNATIAAFDATAPSTQAFGDAAVVGSVNFAARRDHKHAMPAAPTAHTHDGTGGATSLIIGGTAEAGASIPVASSVGAIAIGDYAGANTGTQVIAIGTGISTTSAPTASAQGAIAVGASNATGVAGAKASGICSIAIGSAEASGAGALASGASSVAIGKGTTATASLAVALGQGADALGIASVAIGATAWVGYDLSIAIGDASSVDANSDNCIALGSASWVSNSNSYCVAIGSDSNVTATGLLGASALGAGAAVGHNRSTAVGFSATTTAANQIMLGTATEQVHIPGTLKIPTGAALNKILTSDANGVAAWADSSGGGADEGLIMMGGM